MKAFKYHGGTEFSIDEEPKPIAGAGEAVSKILCASICGTDLRTYRFGNAKIKTPITFGHEACMEITEVGEGVNLNVGDRYIVAPAIGCGECRSCRRGRTNMCDTLKTIGFEYPGTFAEYMKIPAEAIKRNHLIRVPDSVSDMEASVAEPIGCAINGQSYLHIEKGDNVLIYGAGFLGCIHAELALTQGAEKIVIAEISEKRRKKVKDFVPNAYVVDSSRPDYKEEIKSFVGEAGIDVVITAAPAGITHKHGLELLNKNGRISLFGGLPGEENYYLDSNLIHYKEIGVFGSHASTVKQVTQALTMIREGKLDVKKFITPFAFEDVEKAFGALIYEEAEKAVLVP